MRVIICGGRDGYPPASIRKVLVSLHGTYGASLVVIHGAAKGVDATAGALAERMGITVRRFPAKWREHDDEWCPGGWCRKRYPTGCKGAGNRRNHEMLGQDPGLVVAFKRGFDHSLKAGGTEGMCRIAAEANVPYIVIDEDAADAVRVKEDA